MLRFTDDESFDINELIDEICDNISDLQFIVNNANKNQERIEARCLKNIDNFKRELVRCGLLTNELDGFIDNYMRFDNVGEG